METPTIAKIVQPWTQQEAIDLCIRLEGIAPRFGCHVGLTGGALYKTGARRDVDIILYRIRNKSIDREGLWTALSALQITIERDLGFCVKAIYDDCKRIDFLLPESEGGDYPDA